MLSMVQQAEMLSQHEQFNHTAASASVDDIPNANSISISGRPSEYEIGAPATAASAAAAATATAGTEETSVVYSVPVRCSGNQQVGGRCLHPVHFTLAPFDAVTSPFVYGTTTSALGCNHSLSGPECALDMPQSATPIDGKKYLADYQRCWPPPFFMILISCLEIGVFVYDYVTVEPQSELGNSAGGGGGCTDDCTSIPSESVFIYRPDRRLEIWRFVSYMVLHANWFHLSFNVIIQLLYGLPLEMVHGSLRIAAIYLAGVFAGSLGTSVVDSAVYLVGASGGVYALLAAQLANILLNFSQMRSGISQLVSVLIFVSCDLSYALYCKYFAVETKPLPSVSYIAHLTGSLAGFTMGLLVLKNFDSRTRTNLIWWLALGVYSAFTIFAIVFNLINTMTAQMLEQQGEVIKQRLLHDLGIS